MEYDVRDFGALPDGSTVNTGAIQAAINRCHQSGGGSVVIAGGVFVSGTLFLKSNVKLRVEGGAVLKASGSIADYSEDTHHNRYRNETELDRCFLYAEGQENIGIGGTGTIDGNSQAFPNEGDANRPMLLRFLRCRYIRIDDVRLFQAAAWTTAFLDSAYIWVSRVSIYNDRRYNGDGLDFDGCSHVFVEGCSISGTDDNLCLQASSKDFPMQDVHITGCEFTSVCAGIRIGLKSIGDIRDVVIANCTMHSVWREGIKIECTEGGSISDITVNNIVMRDVSRPLFLLLNNRFRPDTGGNSIQLDHMPEIGVMERLLFSNIIAIDSPEMAHPHYRFGKDVMGEPRFNGIRIDAEERHPIRDLTLQNLRYHSIGGVKKSDIPSHYPPVLDGLRFPHQETSENYYPSWSRAAFLDIRNVQGLSLTGIHFSCARPDEREPYFIENCTVFHQEIQL